MKFLRQSTWIFWKRLQMVFTKFMFFPFFKFEFFNNIVRQIIYKNKFIYLKINNFYFNNLNLFI